MTKRTGVIGEHQSKSDDGEHVTKSCSIAVSVDAGGEDSGNLDEKLNAAETFVRDHALQDKCHGILVTQHDFTSFTVALSKDVPYGQTRERRERRPSVPSETLTGTTNASPALALIQHADSAPLVHLPWAGWNSDIWALENSVP